MAKIDNYVTFVKEQIAVQAKLAKKYDEDSYRSGLHTKAAGNFADLARYLEGIQKRGGNNTVAYVNRSDTPQKRILLTFEEIEHLPEELLKELNFSDADRQELLIEYLIAEAGGIQSLDRIMVELYQRTKEIPRRNTITSRLYRMVQRGMIYNVPGKKGVYSTFEMSEGDAKKMFGQFDGEVQEEPAATPATSVAASTSATSAQKSEPKPETGTDRFKRRYLAGTAQVTSYK